MNKQQKQDIDSLIRFKSQGFKARFKYENAGRKFRAQLIKQRLRAKTKSASSK